MIVHSITKQLNFDVASYSQDSDDISIDDGQMDIVTFYKYPSMYSYHYLYRSKRGYTVNYEWAHLIASDTHNFKLYASSGKVDSKYGNGGLLTLGESIDRDFVAFGNVQFDKHDVIGNIEIGLKKQHTQTD